MLQVNWPVVDTIHPQSNKFAMGEKIIRPTDELKLMTTLHTHENKLFISTQKLRT